MMREQSGKMEINITHELSQINSLRRVARTGSGNADAWCNVIFDLRSEKNERTTTA
ncbi:MAG TPA: hypothetical protein VLM75_15645 [Spirochaetota bacterium]|nr:hypothetical protein [Spirochaetota bacterium]